MGGRIGATSKPGQGSLFWAEIPFATVAADRELLQWLPPSGLAGQTPRAAAGQQAANSDSLGLLAAISELDVTAGLRFLNGNAVQYRRLLETFLDHHEQDAARIAERLTAGDHEAARNLAHTLKSVCATLGANRVRDLAARLERLAQFDAPATQRIQTLEKLTETLNALTGALRSALSGDAPEASRQRLPERDDSAATQAPEDPIPEAVDWSQATAVLTQLATLLATSDTEANEIFESSRTLLIAALGNAAQTLDRQIRNFDYAQALETLNAAWKPQ